MSTAGIVIIGNEILTGKIQDENTPYLLRELRRNGVDVPRVHVIPDVIEDIARDVRAFSAAYDYVLTSGGVGPTHDDLTMDGVAAAFDVPLVVNEEMLGMLRGALRGKEPNASHLKMCMLPAGASLITSKDLWFPLVQMRNVFVFPGIPRLLQMKFESARELFKGSPVYLHRVYMSLIESDIAEDLNAVVAEFQSVAFGSYPRTSAEVDYMTLLTLESRDRELAERAAAALVKRMPPGSVVRVE
ncbi:MAG TPA: molybdopterin-binding protein [Myxococcota bacterium]|nr:molybdopterin-binding protein [Myxococcota bacterium]